MVGSSKKIIFLLLKPFQIGNILKDQCGPIDKTMKRTNRSCRTKHDYLVAIGMSNREFLIGDRFPPERVDEWKTPTGSGYRIWRNEHDLFESATYQAR